MDREEVKPQIFTAENIGQLVVEHSIQEIEIDPDKRVIRVHNQADLHRLLLAVRLAEAEEGSELIYGVPGIRVLERGTVRMIDSSHYRIPYQTHQVTFNLPAEEGFWQVFGNHRKPGPSF